MSGAAFLPPGVRRFLQAESKKLLAMTLVSALALIYLTRPKAEKTEGPNLLTVSYSSTGSLLLPSQARLVLAKLIVFRGQSELKNWLVNEQMFQQMMLRKGVQSKIDAELARQFPEVARRFHTVMVLPAFRYENANEEEIEGQSEMGEYATSDASDAADTREKNALRLRRNANRVLVQAYASSPEDSQIVAKVGLRVVQEVLGEVATGRVRGEIKTIQNYIKLTEKRILRGEKQLATLAKTVPEMHAEANRWISILEQRRLALDNQIVNLRREIEQTEANVSLLSALQPNPYQALLQAGEQERGAAANLYKPDSDAFRDILSRVQRLRELTEARNRQSAQGASASLRAELQARLKLLEEVNRDYREWRHLSPSPANQKRSLKLIGEVHGWETELLAWQRKLMVARLEENLCMNEGTSVVLLTPMPGQKVSLPMQQFTEKYRNTLRILPLTPLAALALVLLYAILKDSARVEKRAETYLAAPVLASLPDFHQTTPGHPRGFSPLSRKRNSL